jgi:hypothetical protein
MILLQEEDDSDNKEDADIAGEEPIPNLWQSGSGIGKRPNIERHRVMYLHLLYNHFWGESPVYYNKNYVKRFFKMLIELFDDFVEALVIHDDYFCQKCDAGREDWVVTNSEDCVGGSAAFIGCLVY